MNLEIASIVKIISISILVSYFLSNQVIFYVFADKVNDQFSGLGIAILTIYSIYLKLLYLNQKISMDSPVWQRSSQVKATPENIEGSSTI